MHDRAEEYNALAEVLLHHTESGSTDQSPDIFTVPVTHYTDPERWSREMQSIFKRVPLLVALSIELPKPGDYKATEMLGLPLLIVRLTDNSVRVFLNVCAHRGAPLIDEGCGHRSRFVCRYHGWTYNNEGRLVGVSDREKFGAFDTASRGLRMLSCEERAGLIFAILTPGVPIELSKYLGGMLDELAHYRLESWHSFGHRDIFGANWKVAYDGYLENYHFAALHPTTIAPRSIVSTMQFKAYGPHLRIGFPSTPIRELHTVPRDQWWTKELSHFRAVRTIFPNVAVSLAHGVAQIAQILPGPTVDQNRTILNYLAPHAPEDERAATEYEASRKFLGDVTNDEDYVMGMKVQRGLRARAMDDVVFGRNERGNQYFHKWVDWYVADDPVAPTPTL